MRLKRRRGKETLIVIVPTHRVLAPSEDVLFHKVMEPLRSYVRLLRIVIQFVNMLLKHKAGIWRPSTSFKEAALSRKEVPL